jgi:diaminopimelate epimerase
MLVRATCAVLVALAAPLYAFPAVADGTPSNNNLVAVGWVQFAGELRIYPKREDMGKLYDKSCISGMMAAHATKNVKKYNGRHVTVYGELVDWSSFEEKIGQGWSFRGLENYCSSEKVAIISRIVETPATR